MIPYQPSRNDSLSSYGLVPDDDVDAIFLPSVNDRKKNRDKHRSSLIMDDDGVVLIIDRHLLNRIIHIIPSHLFD